MDELLAGFLADEEAAQLDTFGYAEAWTLGEWVLDRARSDNLPVAVTVTLGEQRAFSAALAGTSHDNDLWLDRKIRVVGLLVGAIAVSGWNEAGEHALAVEAITTLHARASS
jgi:uncharacterized protein (UPF0303 family)